MVPLCKDGRLLGDDAEAAQFPDLLARSSEILRDLLGIALGDPPVCRPQRAGFRAEGPFRRSREARLASARTGDGVRRRDDAALVAPPHSAVSGGSSNFRAANRFLRRELANARMKPPRPTGAWPVSDETSKPLPIWRGTEGSNPSPSSGESVSLPELFRWVEKPGFPRGCARQAWRPGRQRHAGCHKIAPTGGNISVAPYSSTAVPLMGSARMPRRSQ
jgi:hypothetical protein